MIVLSVSLASNGVVKVPGYEQLVRFGYTKNRGVYRLAVAATGEWEGLTIRAFWHVPGGKDPASSLVADGSVDVPASVTVQPGNGCVTFEGSDGAKTVTSADLRYRVAANSGTEDGTTPEPGTPAWQQLVDAVHADATAAEQAKNDAQTAANQAGASAGEAAASAKNAGQSAAEALAWADSAKKSALAAGSNSQNAAQYAGEAKSFAEQAANSSSAAESSASAAAGSQQAAESSAKKSDASANTAQESATRATGSASKAAQAQKNAETAADRAETAQQKTEEVRTDALDKISAAKADALKAVDAKQADATAAVERTQKKVLDAVTAAQDTAVKAVSDAQSTATQAVQTAQTDAVSAVEKAGSEVLESIPEDYQTTVKKVEELKTGKAEIDDTTVGLDAWSSKHIVDMLCPPLEETGNPVQCYPVADYPLGVTASWEPTQEGSGEPYPAGGGKNLFNPAWMPEKALNNGLTWTIAPDGTVTATGTADGTSYYNSDYFSLPAGTYTISAMSHFRISILNRDADNAHTIAVQIIGQPYTFTVESDIQKATLFFAAAGTLDNASAKPQIEKGSAATAYAPYENIRLIKGRDSVMVTRCGENLLNITPFTKVTEQGITYEYVANGGVHISGTATAAVDSPTFAVGHLPPGKYYGLNMDTDIFASIVVQRNGANLRLNAKGVFEILAGDVTKYWYMIATNGATLDRTVYPYIVPGTTAPTTYAPYTGQTATLTLPHTIYGGTVDAVTGEGQETWKLVTLDGTERWERRDNATSSYSCDIKPAANPLTNCLCSMLPWKRYAYAIKGNEGYFAFESSGGRVHFCTTETWETVDAWKSYIAAQYAAGTPVQIAYKLAEPVPFTATGAQPFPALAGVNTVLTDADSVTVTGRADPIKRITDLEDAVASMTNT